MRYRVFLAFLVCGLMIGCQRAPLKVAVLASLGGAREGAQLAADECNARGGVLGRQIALVVKGTSSDNPESATQAAREAITGDKVSYIVGDIFSALSIAVADVANAAKVIQITPTSTNAGVTVDASGATKAYVFRACFDDATQGTLGAVFAVKHLRARKAFVMFDPSNVYSTGLAQAFSTAFTSLGGTVVGKGTYSAMDNDFSRILARIKSVRPEVIYLSSLSLQVVNTATQEARQKGITAPFLGGDGWDDPALDPKAADGSYFTTHYWPGDPRPEAQTFAQAYRARYGEDPSFVAALSYDSVNLLLTAIRSAGADNTEAVRTALEKVSFDGVTGKIAMNARHTPLKGAVVLHITGGKVAFDSYVSP